MAIEYVRMTSEAEVSLLFAKELYEQAFPEQERRPWPSFLNLLATVKEMHFDVIRNDQQDVGIIIWWKINGWMFIEHLAMSETVRGKGLGAAVMKYYLAVAEGKILLEVEPPLAIDANRRIHFYERLGFSLLSYPYEQPCYRDALLSYPMCLMASCPGAESEIFGDTVNVLKKTVYFR